MKDFQLISDSREQMPLDLPHGNVITKGLRVGDYSIAGYDDKFTVEHKSIKDLIGTCDGSLKEKGKPESSNRERFRREVARMKDGFDFYCIVISWLASEILPECLRIAQIQRREGKTRVMSPETRAKGVIGSLKAFRVDYNCHHYFLGTREHAAEWIAEQAKYYMRHK